MSCSACTAITLQRFIGSCATATKSLPTAYHARVLRRIGAQRQSSTSYSLRTTDTGNHDTSKFHSSDSTAFENISASSTNQWSRARRFHPCQYASSINPSWSDRLQKGRGEAGKGLVGISLAHASKDLGLYQEGSRPQATTKAEKSSGQKGWNEIADKLESRNAAEVRRPKAATDRGSVSKFYTPSLTGGRPQASPQNESEGRKPLTQNRCRPKHDGRTKSWAPKGFAVLDDDGKSPPEREPWQLQKSALSEKFGHTGWLPRKRLSPDTLEGIRALHAQYPDKYTTPVLADQFEVSSEAIRRILKSKWRPNDEEEEERRDRWNKRGESIWSQMAELGVKPPKKWRQKGIGRLSELVARGQYAAPVKWRSRMPSDAQRLTTALAPAPVHESSKDQMPLADRIL